MDATGRAASGAGDRDAVRLDAARHGGSAADVEADKPAARAATRKAGVAPAASEGRRNRYLAVGRIGVAASASAVGTAFAGAASSGTALRRVPLAVDVDGGSAVDRYVVGDVQPEAVAALGRMRHNAAAAYQDAVVVAFAGRAVYRQRAASDDDGLARVVGG